MNRHFHRSPLRILLADDHELLRKGVRTLIAEHRGWSVCGEAANGRHAVKLALATKPDVVVLDIEMPELNGMEAARSIKLSLPQTEILIYTMYDTEHIICKVLQAGVRGYVLKSEEPQKLVEAIEALGKHTPYFGGAVSHALLHALLKSKGESDEFSLLTARELQIVRLLADGKSNRDIASQFRKSVKTVETHRASIMRKLGINSITELVRYAIRNKLIQP
jgi:DNA-binding NarL/FixJ family response regulator